MARKNVLFSIFLLLSLILYFGNYQQRLAKAAFLSKTFFFPFISSINKINDLFELKHDYDELVQDMGSAELYIQQLEKKIKLFEAPSLDEDLKTDYDFLTADVIAYRGDFEEKIMILNKGSKDGVEIDHPVISTGGVAGKILMVSHNYSVLVPYNHSTFKLGVMLRRNNLQGILQSDIYGNTSMTLIPRGANINIGDEVVTSSLSTIFPEGFPVGKVMRLQEATDKINMQAKIDGSVEPASLKQVFILLFKKDLGYEIELN
jgi:rod shape-determining protein MreC